MNTVFSWLMGLLGWGGVAVAILAVVMGWKLLEKWIPLIAAAAALGLLAWGWNGYRAADAAAEKLTQAETDHKAQVKKLEGERDKAQGERDSALGVAETCSKSVDSLEKAAKQREADAAPAREQAAKRAVKHKTRAETILATPASVPNDDAESARQRAWQWLDSRNGVKP